MSRWLRPRASGISSDRRQSVPSGYGNSYFWVKPDRIVPLDRVFEVSERLNFRGEILKPLDEGGSP